MVQSLTDRHEPLGSVLNVQFVFLSSPRERKELRETSRVNSMAWYCPIGETEEGV